MADAVATYIHAKDGNRPHLLDAVFAEDATLHMEVRTDAIAFPPATAGREAIVETLVRRFNQTYENVYTLCIGPPPDVDAEHFSCDWLVAMSEKDRGAVRVGCGRYDWSFAHGERKVGALTVTIEAMAVLPSQALMPVMHWVSGLPYPWCDRPTAAGAAPDIPGLLHVLGRLKQGA